MGTGRGLDGDAHVALAAVAHHGEIKCLSNWRQALLVAQVVAGTYRPAVGIEYDVTFPQPRLVGRAAGDHGVDHCAFNGRKFLLLRDVLGDLANGRDANSAALDFTEARKLVHHPHRHVGWHCEADADVTARRADDGRVDADQLTAQIDQRATRIARVDRGIGLDEIFIAFNIEPGAAERRNDAGRDGLPNAKWVADGQHIVPHLQRIRFAHLDRGEPLSRDLHQRDVGGGVRADQFGRELAAVAQGDDDFGGTFHHMVIGQHVALGRIHDDAGARRLRLPRPFRRAEEAAEERVVEHRVVALGAARERRDVDHAGCRLIDYRCERRHRTAEAGRRLAGHRRGQTGLRQALPGEQGQQAGGGGEKEGANRFHGVHDPFEGKVSQSSRASVMAQVWRVQAVTTRLSRWINSSSST